jgi:hypothetical protein
MKPNARENVIFYIIGYASNPFAIGFLVPYQPQDKTFYVRDLRLFMLPTFN